MKLNINQLSFFISLSASLLVSSIHAQTTSLNLQTTFLNNNKKNIAFYCPIGGASHVNWVLNIGDELGQRGHNFTFLTCDEQVSFGSHYNNVQTASIGPGIEWDAGAIFNDELKETTKKNPAVFMSQLMTLLFTHFERDYTLTRQYFIDHKVDVALCDQFADACVDAATELNIPYIITAALDISKDTSAPYVNNDAASMNFPTTETEPFVDRFMNKFIKPIINMKTILPVYQGILDRKCALGIDAKLEDRSSRWRNSIKLSNSLFGFTPARPLGPLAEFVGPIMPKQYKPLPQNLEAFLNAHTRVAYVAFGQMATPSERDIQLILLGLLESIERGTLDAFIWATVHAASRFPDTITTSTGTVYNIKDMFDHVNPYGCMVKWAPQAAILHHASTTLFVSHGGLGSWYESMYTATPMIVFPFFGDQMANGIIVETSGLGGVLRNEHSVEQAVKLFQRVTSDESGEIANNIKRMQALAQIHSRHGVIRGADIVEEVAYTHVNGRLPHRESAARRMSFIKSHNLDLYCAMVFLVSFGLFAIALAVKVGLKLAFKQPSTQKLKKL